MDVKTKLKMKRKVLAAESKILRHQELKWAKKAKLALARSKDPAFQVKLMNQLHSKRKNNVRMNSRISHIINAFLKGDSYYSVEQKFYTRNISGWTIIGFYEKIARELWNEYYTNKTIDEVRTELFNWIKEHPGIKEAIEVNGTEFDHNRALALWNLFGDVLQASAVFVALDEKK